MAEVKAVAWMDPDGSRVIPAKIKRDSSAAYRSATADYSVPLVPESALAALRDEVERLEAIAVLAKRAQWFHSACWDLADGSGCFINTDSMRRFDEVFNDLGVALGDIVIDADEERELFERPGARAARLEADNARLIEGLRDAFVAMQISFHDNTAVRFHEMGAVMDLSTELGVRLCSPPLDNGAALAEKEGGK